MESMLHADFQPSQWPSGALCCGVSSSLRTELRTIVETLAGTHAAAQEISLDTLGEAIGTRSVSYVEIDAMIDALEARGLQVIAGSGGHGEAHLGEIVRAAKELSVTLGRSPRVEEIAAHARLSVPQVRHALALARVMQR